MKFVFIIGSLSWSSSLSAHSNRETVTAMYYWSCGFMHLQMVGRDYKWCCFKIEKKIWSSACVTCIKDNSDFTRVCLFKSSVPNQVSSSFSLFLLYDSSSLVICMSAPRILASSFNHTSLLPLGRKMCYFSLACKQGKSVSPMLVLDFSTTCRCSNDSLFQIFLTFLLIGFWFLRVVN